MARDNVDLVRWFIDMFNRRDLDACVSRMDEDVEWVPALIPRAEAAPEDEFRGVEGFRRWIAATDEVFEDFRVDADSVHELEDNRVLLLGTVTGRGRASGADVRAELGQVFTFSDGRMVSYRGYLDRAEARAAVGWPG